MTSYDIIIVHYISCDLPDHPLSIDMLSVFFSFLVPVEDTPIVWRLRSVVAAKEKQRFSRRLFHVNQERFPHPPSLIYVLDSNLMVRYSGGYIYFPISFS
jgi:hypothetical protein